MRDTTMRISTRNRDEVKAVAAQHALTIDGALALLLRRYRQLEIGDELAELDLEAADTAVLEAGARTVARR